MKIDDILTNTKRAGTGVVEAFKGFLKGAEILKDQKDPIKELEKYIEATNFSLETMSKVIKSNQDEIIELKKELKNYKRKK